MYLAPQNIPLAIVLTFGNKVILDYIVLYDQSGWAGVSLSSKVRPPSVKTAHLIRQIQIGVVV